MFPNNSVLFNQGIFRYLFLKDHYYIANTYKHEATSGLSCLFSAQIKRNCPVYEKAFTARLFLLPTFHVRLPRRKREAGLPGGGPVAVT